MTGPVSMRDAHRVMADAWQMYREFVLTDEHEMGKQERLAEVSMELFRQHGKSDFAKAILVATVVEVERAWGLRWEKKRNVDK